MKIRSMFDYSSVNKPTMRRFVTSILQIVEGVVGLVTLGCVSTGFVFRYITWAVGYEMSKRTEKKRNFMKSNQDGYTLGELLVFIVMIFGFIGYVMNIFKLMNISEIGMEFIVRVIGVLTGAGAIIGYF